VASVKIVFREEELHTQIIGTNSELSNISTLSQVIDEFYIYNPNKAGNIAILE